MAGCPDVPIVSFLVVAFSDSDGRDPFSREPRSLKGALVAVGFSRQ